MAACASNGDNNTDAQISADMLQHHNWQLTQVDGKDITTPEKKWKLHVLKSAKR